MKEKYILLHEPSMNRRQSSGTYTCSRSSNNFITSEQYTNLSFSASASKSCSKNMRSFFRFAVILKSSAHRFHWFNREAIISDCLHVSPVSAMMSSNLVYIRRIHRGGQCSGRFVLPCQIGCWCINSIVEWYRFCHSINISIYNVHALSVAVAQDVRLFECRNQYHCFLIISSK